ncbi:ATP synthase subunit C lysine N-methyltransferase isoform X3 [Oryctolagus cuniculus]|uniref:ATP synthase subunit C lysine N-methyltransferase isoform X3 n=1 Tax=Oryctolagus cuniculus TaxID=9986 RepID=UPI00048E423D|nr:ATP synthase subunit C lysine N-methyltransferase isoform X3 [Oryctolagus cuniculus]
MEGGGGAAPEPLQEESQAQPGLPPSLEANTLKKSRWGLLLTGIVGGTLMAVYAVATPFVTPALRKVCLPFVPATTKQIENVVKMLQSRSGSLVDIGSGDGRIVVAAAKAGFTAVGYELNPWLVWYSRYRAWQEGVHGSTKFYISDLWKELVETRHQDNSRPPLSAGKLGSAADALSISLSHAGLFLAVHERCCVRRASDDAAVGEETWT